MESAPKSDDTDLVEMGWMVVGRIDRPDREAIRIARDEALSYVREALPSFSWAMPLFFRDEVECDLREEPVVLLDHGVTERNIKHWDFAVTITGADLIGHDRSYAIAVLSRSLQSAVISTSRLDPRATRSDAEDDERVAAISRRIEALVLHFLGHWGGLPHADDETCMASPKRVEDLDELSRFSAEQCRQMKDRLEEIADRRLEEKESFHKARPVVFYAFALWQNLREIGAAIWQAAPWQFPMKLSRLLVAAVSTMLILLMTAEAWEVGMRQPLGTVLFLSATSVAVTSSYVLLRQRLLLPRRTKRRTEQHALTNASTIAIVVLGMLTTYAVLFTLTLLCTRTLFAVAIVERWAQLADTSLQRYVNLSGMVASLGLLIGALGASFEHEAYIRHITFVDEEV